MAGRVLDLIVALDEKPVLAVGIPLAAHSHQRPSPLQLVSIENEIELSAVEVGAFVRSPPSAIPEHDGAAAVFALRDDPFEVAVFERVILDLNGEVFFAGHESGPFGTAQLLNTPSSSRRKS